MSITGHWFVRYAFAVAASLAALLFRLGIIRLTGGDLPHYITFYPVVMMVALFAGLGPGLASTATSALVAALWVVPPYGDLAGHGFADIAGIFLFTGMGVFMSVVGGRFRRTRDSLKIERKRLFDVLETLPAYLVLLTPDHRFLFVNKFFRDRFGECEGRLCYEYLFQRTEPCENCETYKTLQINGPHHWEWKGPDGRNYDIYDYPFTDADGSTLIMEMGIDITEQKRAEEELHETLATLEVRVLKRTAELARAKEEWERTFDSVPDLIAILDNKHTILRVNKAMADRVGTTPDECIGQRCYKVVHGLEAPPPFCPHLLTIADGKGHQVEVHEDRLGGDFIVTTTSLMDSEGGYIGSVHVAHDITERKNAEKALARQREELQTILDSAPTSIFYKDTENRFLRVNNAFCGLMGRKREDLENRSIFDIYPKEQAEAFWKDDKEVIASGKPKLDIIEAVETGDGVRLVQTDKVPYRDAQGNIVGVIGFALDITERKRAEGARRESEEGLKRAQEIAHLGSWELDVVNNRLTWSDEVYRIFGLEPQEFAATYEAFLEAVHPDDRKDVDDAYSASLREGRDIYEVEHRIVRRATGEIRFVHERCEHLRDDYGRVIRSVGMVHDITERKEAEHELMKFYEELERRVQQRTDELLLVKRLSDIGTLAATVAHELRNPLGVIQLAIENMRRKKIDEETEKHLSRIEKKVAESNLIIDNLSFYSRIRQPHFENVQPLKILNECIGTARAAYKEKGVSIEADLDPITDAFIEADPVQLKEVFNNIITNAYQAFKDAGGRIQLKGSKEGDDSITIVVKDNGIGIPKEDLERVHEPFFSTKSKGTGLGLTICNELIGMHSGRMEIESEVGVGTTVTLCLPVKRSEQCEIRSS